MGSFQPTNLRAFQSICHSHLISAVSSRCVFHWVSAPTSHSSTTTSSVKASTKCSESTCHRVANSVCIWLMCKKCCITHTGCSIHMVTIVVANQWKGKQPWVPAATSPSLVHHSPTTPSLSPAEELQIVIANMDPTVQFMCSVAASTWEADLAHAQELSNEAKEEADYQAALAALLGHSPLHNATHLSPTDFASTSHVTSLHITSSSHVASSLYVVSSLHVASLHSTPLSLVYFMLTSCITPQGSEAHKSSSFWVDAGLWRQDITTVEEARVSTGWHGTAP